MPTFTAIALQSLLESSTRDPSSSSSSSSSSSRNTSQHKNKKIRTSNNENGGSDVVKMKPPRHIYISPALYTTPEPTPIPDTSLASFSPSPYVINHKRRDVRVPDAVNNHLDGFEIRLEQEKERALDGLNNDGENNNLVGSMGEWSASMPFIEDAEVVEVKGEEDKLEKDESTDDFFDPRDSMSVASCSSDTDDLPIALTPVSNQSVFFDADEEFFSDGSTSNTSASLGPSIEVELHCTSLKLIEEIERRKRAEDALGQMQNQWQRISRQLSQLGLSFPTSLDVGNNMQVEVDSMEQYFQEVVVASFVSEAIGRGQARAEVEAVAEAIIESKNQEISRLRDRLQYYEAVNQEMSNRNQEVMEIARRQRQKRKTRQKWVWSCIGLSVTLGASILAYSWFLPTDKHLVVNPIDSNNASSGKLESD